MVIAIDDMGGRPKELELETKACQDDEMWVEEVISYTCIHAVLMATRQP